MIGFYVVTCDVGKDAKFNDGKAGLLAETDFVPLHQGMAVNSAYISADMVMFWLCAVSATVTIPFDSLSGSKSVLILPCTFDPEKEGPFNLSVTMDCDFDLTPAS